MVAVEESSFEEIGNILYVYFETYGIKIYEWHRHCWNPSCNRMVLVKTYLLNLQLSVELEQFHQFCDSQKIKKFNPQFQLQHRLHRTDHIIFVSGIGDIPEMDRYLLKKDPKIFQTRYSVTTQLTLPSCICPHCLILQGYNFLVATVEEIYSLAKIASPDLNRFISFSVKPSECGLTPALFKTYYYNLASI